MAKLTLGERFLQKFLLNKDEDGDLVKELYPFTLRFKDEKLEALYQTLYNPTIAPLNERIIKSGVFVVILLTIWDFIGKTKFIGLYVANGIRASALICCLVYLLGHKFKLFNVRHEQKTVFLGYTVAFLGSTCYKSFYDLITPAKVVPVEQRPFATLDEMQNLVVFGTAAYILSNIKYVAYGNVIFYIMNACIYLLAQVNRLNGTAVVLINIASVEITAFLLSYRKESYYRRIFWMKYRIDPEFTAADEATIVFKNLVSPTVESYSSLDDFKKMDEETKKEEEKQQKLPFSQRFQKKFLLFHDTMEQEEEFNKFLCLQSIGQTRITLWAMATAMVVGVIAEYFSKNIRIEDVIIRAAICPALLLSVSISRVLFAKKTYGPRLLRHWSTTVLVLMIGLYLAGSYIRSRNPLNWGDESVYVVGITTLTLTSSTAFGMRFYSFFFIGIGYFFASLALQVICKYKNNGFIIGANATFLVSGIFLHQYEKIMYVFYILKCKCAVFSLERTQKSSVEIMAASKTLETFKTNTLGRSKDQNSMGRSNGTFKDTKSTLNRVKEVESTKEMEANEDAHNKV